MPATKLTKKSNTKGKRTKKGKQLRRQKRSRKVHFEEEKYKIPRVYIQNFGSSETYMDVNNKKTGSKLKWMGDYDGETAKLQVDVNNNNNRKVYKIELDNKQLSRLLSMPSADMPLDKRLRTNFLGQNPEHIMELDMDKMPNKLDTGNNRNVMILETGLPRDM